MSAFGSTQRFISGWQFPVLLISIVTFLLLFMLAMLFMPDSAGAASAFAEDFRVWCFGYDPATGTMEWGYVFMFLVQPFILISIIIGVWAGPLREILSQAPAKVLPYVGGSLGLVIVLAAGLVGMASAPQADPETAAFPADRLRTTHATAPFALTNQLGEPVNIEELRGRVVVVTAVYASCSYTCPILLMQTKRSVDALTPAEQEDLTVIAITLDPEHDRPEILRQLMNNHGVSAPRFNALTGDPAYVNRVLDRYGFTRSRRPDSDIIDHANLILVVDRSGRIAYRFSLGPLQERWMTDALRLLLDEAKPV